ncbi:Hsp70 [Coccidioides immitis RMSCC 3703]|uniref:Hsp70 n=1 Tax=Coccidioides immitis RMSCC 3703 TaxID=454286 RepID=A0A0J8QKX8_COCIT|nr:Hsp70 [Coccidioides immitis RMSCC 3703]
MIMPVYFNNKAVSAREDLLHVLIKMGETADSYLDGTVNNAGVTVPVYFNNKAVSTKEDLLHDLDQDEEDG